MALLRVVLTVLLGVLTFRSWSHGREGFTQDDVDALHSELCPRIFIKVTNRISLSLSNHKKRYFIFAYFYLK